MKPIFSITIAKKRDILLAQVRARQLCRMLGFTPLEQARIVSLIFELACNEARRRSFTLSLRVQDRQFQVVCAPISPRVPGTTRPVATPRLLLTLPVQHATLSVEDTFWAMDRIQRLSKPDLFDEIRQQNADLLRALAELQRATCPAGIPSVRSGAA
jgi:hypothetical protein